MLKRVQHDEQGQGLFEQSTQIRFPTSPQFASVAAFLGKVGFVHGLARRALPIARLPPAGFGFKSLYFSGLQDALRGDRV
jgi:hypothetical protein